MPVNKTAASLLIVIGASALVMIILYIVFSIPITVLGAVVDTLLAIGLVLARAFLKNSIALRPGPVYFSVVAYILATASFIYSFSYGEAWVPFLLGVFFDFIAGTGTLVAVRFRKASAIGGSNL
jgi:hypothetical protein